MASYDDRSWAEVAELLERRATVQRWLERLQEQRGTVSDKILERVRQDYENRLRETLEALSGHRDSISSQLERATTRLVEAEEQHTQAQEALEEGRLRNVIGEIGQEAWEAERSELEAAVGAAREAESSAREETARLRDLLDQLDEKAPPREPSLAETDTVAEPPPAPEAPLPSLETPAPAEPYGQSTATFSAVPAEDSDPVEEMPRIMLSDDPPPEETAPKPGLKCPECGYTNDLSAWFCGVCGADIG